MSQIKVQVSLAGDVETVNLLRELPDKLVKGALRKSLREAAKTVLRGAKFRAPRKSGLLTKTLKVRAFKRTRKNVVGFTVGTAAGDYKGQSFYGAFQEYGWTPTGRHRQSSALRSAQKWIRREKQEKSKSGAVPLVYRKKITAAKLTVAKDTRRRVKPKHFLRNAFSDNAAAIQADLVKSIKSELQAAVLKAATPKAPKK
jgi:HK97 gp10 family phage protein